MQYTYWVYCNPKHKHYITDSLRLISSWTHILFKQVNNNKNSKRQCSDKLILQYCLRTVTALKDASPPPPPLLCTYPPTHTTQVLVQKNQRNTVQFSSRWYLCSWKSQHALHPISPKFAQCCLWNVGKTSERCNGANKGFFKKRNETMKQQHNLNSCFPLIFDQII